MVERQHLHRVETMVARAGGASAAPASVSDLQITYVSPARLRPAATNARAHSKKQLKQIARSIERFGFVNPVLVSDDFEIIAGHGRVEAAKLLGLRQVPTVCLSKLSSAERRAYVIADNRLAELAGWDRELLASELHGLLDLQFDDIEATGFSPTEIDLVLDDAVHRKARAKEPAAEDALPANVLQAPAVSQAGDLWLLGSHRLLCGDAADAASYQSLLAGAQAALVLAHPPLDVAVEDDISDLGRGEQVNMATASDDAIDSGDAPARHENCEDQSVARLTTSLQRGKENSKDGALLFVFVDWRQLYALIAASRNAGLNLADLVVWTKTDGAAADGFYPCRHELVLVLRNGETPSPDAAALVRRRRRRTNVWDHADVARAGADPADDRTAIRTALQPVALVADAILDATRHGDIVLDPFAGAGTTIIAAEKTGRQARAIERDPLYCDLIVRRFQQYTGKAARLEGSELSFTDVEAMRLAGRSAPDTRNRESE